MPLMQEFYEIDGHTFYEVTVRSALGPLLRDDSLGQVWLIGDDDSGYAVVTWGYSLESGGRDALLDEFYVRRRNEGWGGAALEAILAAADAAGASRLFLETEAPNDAVRRFYRRHGFAPEPSVWMRRDLRRDG